MLSSIHRGVAKGGAVFGRSEDGSLIIFSLFIFVVMLMFGGIAVDLMIYENRRTHVQNSTDRAVLAAANLNQSVDPTTVVIDYLAKSGITVSASDVNVVEIGTAPVITGRQVSVDVNTQFDTLLMNLVGVNSLPYGGHSQAEEAVNDIEVSLVLDVSGSMRESISTSAGTTKLEAMQTAAKDFVDTILAGSSDNRVSISLVPYSTQVNVGPDLFSRLNTQYNHNYSHCVNFSGSQFNSTAINFSAPLSQTAHFDPWLNYRYGMDHYYTVCRNEADFQVTPWSNDASALKNQIDGFTANGNTSIDVAVKWGAALLDPSMNWVLNDLISDPGYSMNAAFTPRPHPYSYDDVVKFIVVMTDGINTDQPYLHNSSKTGNSPYFRNPLNGKIYMERQEPGNRDGDSRWGEAWYNVTDRNWTNNPFAGTAGVQMSWLDAWASMTMSWRAYAEYHQTYNASDYYAALYDPRGWVSPATKDARLDNICSAAKNNGIIVFTVGFEVTDHSAGVMRSCASTPQHFYRVEGLDIEYAFASIANQINQLKLTQ
jgi:Flp pilus assembly protein TadG